MNYEEMNDGEITWRVHHIVNKVPKGHATICIADYCNNPSDAWPIIVENGISLVWMNAEVSYYEAHGINEEIWDEDWQSQHPNALRAAMICFLKMKDAEK